MSKLAASISKALIGVGLWDLLGAMNAWWVCLFHQQVLGYWWILALPWGAWNYLFNLKAWIDVWELITTPSWLVPYTLRQSHLHFENSNYIWYLCMFACVWGTACYLPNLEREGSMTGAYCMLTETRSQYGFSTFQLCQILHWGTHVNPLLMFICFLWVFRVFVIIFLLKTRSCRSMKSRFSVLLEIHLVLWSQIWKASPV